MIEINKKQIKVNEETETIYLAKKLLIDCESKYEYLYNIGFSKKFSNIYKLMQWLEDNNKITNHIIESNSKIYIPENREDYIKVISNEAPLAKGIGYRQEDFEIKYSDTIIFQHKYRPGKKRNDKNQVSEDMTYGDLNSVEIVKKNPMLYPFFKDLNHFISLRESLANQLVRKGLSTNTSVQFQEIQSRIENLQKSIVNDSKQEMEWLIKTCSQDSEWRELAMKLYKRFCKNDDTDYKNDNLLNKLFTEHTKTKECIKDFRERFEMYIKKYNYDVVMFDVIDFTNSIYGEYLPKEKGVKRPIFENYLMDSVTGPMLCFHDTQGFDVVARNIKIKNGKFVCDLFFDFYDHFGLDSQDLVTFDIIPSVRTGIQGWYILQHFSDCETGCKPFIDHAFYEEKVELQIEI